jgi:hypothetical protein
MQSGPEDSGIRDQVIEMIRDITRSRRAINDGTRLFHDLSISGDDAADFLDLVQQRFSVQMSALKFDEYFPNEPDGILYFKGKFLGFGQGKKELTVGHLLKVIERGHWVDP